MKPLLCSSPGSSDEPLPCFSRGSSSPLAPRCALGARRTIRLSIRVLTDSTLPQCDSEGPDVALV